tara:strand:+ start:41551 stop:42321 length:771 start_codon:yes stop_codon:yes gene_type:complete
MQRVEQAWRLVFTGLAFALFGIGGVLLSITVFPLLNVFVRDRDRRTSLAHAVVHWAFRAHVRYMVMFGVISVEFKGGEKLEGDRGTLMVANHPSLLDVVFLISVIKRAQCIVKYQIWRNPFMRGVVSASGFIRNDGDPETLVADCAADLAAGRNIVIFPEGSRTVPGEPMKLQRGVANIAVRTGAPIRLITISCVPPSLMKGLKWYEIPPVRSHFTITIHELIEMNSFMGDFSPSVAARHLNAYLLERLDGGIRVG